MLFRQTPFYQRLEPFFYFQRKLLSKFRLNKTEKIETEPRKTNPDPANNSWENKGKDELRAKVKANLEQSATVREASRFDEYLKKEKELLEAIEKKNTSQTLERTGRVQTGGRELSVDEYLKRLDTADAMYESFRKSNVDVQNIAKNTGMPENRVQRIKDHLFFKEHIKEHGVGRFEADYEIAQAWDRLQKGTFKQQDIDLLNHELFESKFEGIFKTDYRTAHDRTVDSGRPWYPPEEE